MSDILRHRVWNIKRQCFLTARNTVIDNNGDVYEVKGGLIPLNMDNHIVDRCTGLWDATGLVLIYASDILNDNKGEYGLIQWNASICMFEVVADGHRFFLNEGNSNNPIQLSYTSIIGNIHENPELLK